MGGPGIGFFIRVMKNTLFAAFTCIVALDALFLVAMVGIIVGATKGQTTETGFSRGAGIGAVAGAITAVQLLESLASMTDGESLSKMKSLESTHREMSDINDVNGVIKGLSKTTIQQLPVFVYQSSKNIETWDKSSCSICLREPKDGESVRKLQKCGHFFHLKCIDEWLISRDHARCAENMFLMIQRKKHCKF